MPRGGASSSTNSRITDSRSGSTYSAPRASIATWSPWRNRDRMSASRARLRKLTWVPSSMRCTSPDTCDSRTRWKPPFRLRASTNDRLMARPISIPISRSVNTIASTVARNGTNCIQPARHFSRNSFGEASLTPVTTSTAASAASGMRLISGASSSTLSSSSTPCVIVASRDRPPALTLTELRTITDVIGRPPNAPANRLPKPCATSSRLGLAGRRPGSSFSVASRLSSVSSDATAAMVIAANRNRASSKREKSGNRSRSCMRSPPSPTTGTATR